MLRRIAFFVLCWADGKQWERFIFRHCIRRSSSLSFLSGCNAGKCLTQWVYTVPWTLRLRQTNKIRSRALLGQIHCHCHCHCRYILDQTQIPRKQNYRWKRSEEWGSRHHITPSKLIFKWWMSGVFLSGWAWRWRESILSRTSEACYARLTASKCSINEIGRASCRERV